MKIAINGGKRQISYKMPPRFAFGSNEQKEVEKMVKYYKTRGQDPKFSGIWEKKFSNLFSKYQGGGYSNIVATGTGAIYIAMKALELPKNSDVLICPVTCAGNFSCITEQGHNPILLDSKKMSYNIDLTKIKERITKKTKLIQLTHVAGQPIKDIKKIAKFAKEKKIFLLEDCSQAVGAQIDGQKTGTFGDISAFSIMYRKILAANSSGGIVFTKKLKLHHKSLAYGDRGKILWKENLDFRDPKYSLFPALNWNTDEFSCAIGYANLKRLDKSNNMRKKFVFNFLKLLKESKVCFNNDFHSGYAPFFLPIYVKLNNIRCSKIQFAKALKAEGVDLGEHYGCLVNVWPWTKKYLLDKFIAKNSIATRNNCFHLFLNENYKKKHAQDIVKAILKVEKFYQI